jgi:hypothetical protein
MDQPETLDHLEALDLEERQDRLEPSVALDSLELRAPVDHLDQLDNPVPLGLQGLWETLGRLDQVDRRDFLEEREPQVFLEVLDSLVR